MSDEELTTSVETPNETQDDSNVNYKGRGMSISLMESLSNNTIKSRQKSVPIGVNNDPCCIIF